MSSPESGIGRGILLRVGGVLQKIQFVSHLSAGERQIADTHININCPG